MKREAPPMIFEEYENRETFTERYKRRIRQNPALSLGLLGLTGMLCAGAYKFKKLRAQGMSVSIFLINLRVAAQGMVAGALSIALISHYVNEELGWNESKDQSPKKT